MSPVETPRQFVAPILRDMFLAFINRIVFREYIVSDFLVERACQGVIANKWDSQFPRGHTLQNVFDMQCN
jgi:hypothetical protein